MISATILKDEERKEGPETLAKASSSWKRWKFQFRKERKTKQNSVQERYMMVNQCDEFLCDKNHNHEDNIIAKLPEKIVLFISDKGHCDHIFIQKGE